MIKLPIIGGDALHYEGCALFAGKVHIEDGRQWLIVGEASSVEEARRKIRRMLDSGSRYLIEHCGFQLNVFRRDAELLGGIEGWRWAIGK